MFLKLRFSLVHIVSTIPRREWQAPLSISLPRIAGLEPVPQIRISHGTLEDRPGQRSALLISVWYSTYIAGYVSFPHIQSKPIGRFQSTYLRITYAFWESSGGLPGLFTLAGSLTNSIVWCCPRWSRARYAWPRLYTWISWFIVLIVLSITYRVQGWIDPIAAGMR